MSGIGVLALQGDFIEHIKTFSSLGVSAQEIRKVSQISDLDALVIPGGESTTISYLMDLYGFRTAIQEAVLNDLPIWGTCAGLILMANQLKEDIPIPLNLMDINVSRNAYGRQIDSFKDEINFSFDNENPFPGVFIRAPKILDIGQNVDVICTLNDGEVVGVKQGNNLGTSFHPELTTDNRFHKYFIDLVYS